MCGRTTRANALIDEHFRTPAFLISGENIAAALFERLLDCDLVNGGKRFNSDAAHSQIFATREPSSYIRLETALICS